MRLGPLNAISKFSTEDLTPQPYFTIRNSKCAKDQLLALLLMNPTAKYYFKKDRESTNNPLDGFVPKLTAMN
jgi:hypothetical protein